MNLPDKRAGIDARVAFLCALILGVIVFRYGAMANHYAYAYMVFNNPAVRAADFILRENFFFDASFIFPLNRLLRMEDREIVAFGLYILAAVGGAAVVYRIFVRHAALPPGTAALIATLLMCLADRRILTNAWGLIIPNHPGSSSVIGNFFALLTIYWLLERKATLAATAATVTVLFHVKENALLLPIGVVYAVVSGLGWRAAALMLIPFAYPAFKALTAIPMPSLPADIAAQQALIIAAEGRDSLFTLFPWPVHALFIGALIVIVPLAKQMPVPLARLAWVSASLTALLYGANLVYATLLLDVFPNPQILLVGAVRNSRTFLFLFYLVAIAAVVSARQLKSYEKTGLLLALFVVHGESWRGLVYPSIVLIGAFAVPRVAAAVGFFSDVRDRMTRVCWSDWTVASFVALIALQIVVGGIFHFNLNPRAFEYSGRWSSWVKADATTWAAYREVRGMPEVFALIAAYRDPSGCWFDADELVTFSRKAAYNRRIFGSFTTGSAAGLMAEMNRRDATLAKLFESFDAGKPVGGEVVRFLARRNVRVMVPNEFLPLFPAKASATIIGSSALVSFEKYLEELS